MTINYLGAFLGGVLTLLSPCSALLLPAFFAYAFDSKQELVTRTTVFFAGLCTTLIPLGILASSLGAVLNQNRFLLVNIGAVLLIALGFLLIFQVQLPMLAKMQLMRQTGNFAVFALGTIYGLAGVCAGPLLGAVLTFAAFSSNALQGAIIMLLFAFGMTLPLFLLSFVWKKFPQVKKLVQPREVRIGKFQTTLSNLLGGLATIAVGVFLLVTRGTTVLPGVLDAKTQAELESSVLTQSIMIPDWVIVLCAVAVLAAVFVFHRLKKKR